MTSYRPHYIANYEDNAGLNTYFQPFLIPERAFPTLEDAYCYRGQVKRRIGYELLGRLRRVLTTAAMGNISAAGAGTFTFNIFTGLSLLATQPNAQIEPGNVTAISIAIGAPINQTLTDSAGTGTMTIVGAGPITAATISYATGVLTLTFSGAAAASAATFTGAYFPGLPVMGLFNRETTVSGTPNPVTQLMAFDTVYAYKWTGSQFVEFIAGTLWTGLDSDFFWTIDYFLTILGTTQKSTTWTTNFDKTPGATAQPIRYTDGTTWTDFTPALTAPFTKLWQARIIIPYKGRLIVFNTWEGVGPAIDNTNIVNYPQRARWSLANADPTVQMTSWLNPGGGFVDAATNDAITSAEIIKDTLIVKFTNSSWKLVYTGIIENPFRWELINVELGTESTFSIVPFDRGAFSVSNVGITTDDTVNVFRIDQQIPNFIFQVNNSSDPSVGLFNRKRFYGIRDYATQLVFWSFVSNNTGKFFAELKYPNQLLVYNYQNNSYGVWNDSFTALGYFIENTSLTWAQATFKWGSSSQTWGVGQPAFPTIVAGNQQGFVEKLLQGDSANDPSLAITGVTPSATVAVQLTVPNHNLAEGTFIDVDGIIGSGSPSPATLNGAGPYYVHVVNKDTIDLYKWNRSTQFPPNVTVAKMLLPGTPPTQGVYHGGGLITVYNNFDIRTKYFIPYYDDGNQLRVPYIDVLLDATEEGQCNCNIFINENTGDAVDAFNNPLNPSVSGLMQSNVLRTDPEIFPLQSAQDKIWHRFYLGNICQSFQLQFTMSNDQMTFPETSTEDFVMHALTLYTSPNARLVQ